MKVLIIHSYYQIRGGEDVVFEKESALLQKNFTVDTLVFYNQRGFKGALQFFLSAWNFFAMHKVNQKIKAFKPDIVHFHNWHFAFGPAIIRTIKKAGLPVVHTLHNYRLLCPSAILLSNGEIFIDSIKKKFPWKAISKKVYRSSHIQTFWLAFIVWLHKQCGTWKMVDEYILLNEFTEQLFLQSQLQIPSKKFNVKPNFVTAPAVLNKVRMNVFFYAGRLSSEKGIHLLLNTFKNINADLKIAGDGPLKNLVLQISEKHKNIQYAGLLTSEEIEQEMQCSTALIFPSIWYEPFGLTIIEAFANGLPVIASNIGAIKTMVINNYNGLLFNTGNEGSLCDNIAFWSVLKDSEKKQFSENAKLTYEQKYTSEINLNQLKKIYDKALNKDR